jgi:hypothetical protein
MPGRSEKEPLEPELRALIGILLVGLVAVLLDTTIVNVATARLARELHTGVSVVQWVSTGFLLALGVTIPLAAWAGAGLSAVNIAVMAPARAGRAPRRTGRARLRIRRRVPLDDRAHRGRRAAGTAAAGPPATGARGGRRNRYRGGVRGPRVKSRPSRTKPRLGLLGSAPARLGRVSGPAGAEPFLTDDARARRRGKSRGEKTCTSLGGPGRVRPGRGRD